MFEIIFISFRFEAWRAKWNNYNAIKVVVMSVCPLSIHLFVKEHTKHMNSHSRIILQHSFNLVSFTFTLKKIIGFT